MKILLGVGNILLSDDGAGPYLTRNGDIEGWICIDAGTVPENYTRFIREHRPDLLVIVDAAKMGLSPGSVRIIPEELIVETGIGTHQIPMNLLIGYLKSWAERIILVGIEPESLDPGEGLSPRMTEAVTALRGIIVRDEIHTLCPYSGRRSKE